MSVASNLFADLPAHLPQELIETLLDTNSFRIKQIVSQGHVSPPDFWYDQETHEWVLLVSGAARLQFEDGELLEMAAGSFVNIAAHRKHRVEWTHPHERTVWLAIYYDD
jgi:cupin 2 domain-containing protein